MIRASIIYVFALAVVRSAGKRTISPITPMDLVVVFAISDVFDDVIWAGVTTATGLTAIATIALLHVLNGYAAFHSRWFHRIVSGQATKLVESGRILEDDLSAERLGKQDLWSLLRLKEVEDQAEIKEAFLEPDGQVSVRKTERAKEAQKSDKDSLVQTQQ